MTGEPDRAGPALDWCEANGLVPVPCRPGSKAPISAISSRGLYGSAPPAPSVLRATFDRDRFGAVVRDSFHLPTPERLTRVRRFWETPGVRLWGPEAVSISVDMNYPTADGYRAACLDIDDDTCLPLLDCHPFDTCPVVAGRHGAKALFKLDREGARPRAITQFARSIRGPPAFELFTGSKHALIFGHHPASTPEAPVTYRIIRHADRHLPLLGWSAVSAGALEFARDRALMVRKGTGPDLDQVGLERWI